MKRFYDKSVPTRNLVTTIMGIILSLISVLTLVNLITAEQGAQLQVYANDVAGAVQIIVEAVAGIILMFKATDG